MVNSGDDSGECTDTPWLVGSEAGDYTTWFNGDFDDPWSET